MGMPMDACKRRSQTASRAASERRVFVGAETPGSLGASLPCYPRRRIPKMSCLLKGDRGKIPPVPHPPCSGESLGPICPVDFSEPKIFLNSFVNEGAGRHFVNGSASI